MTTKERIKELVSDAPDNFGLAVVLRAVESVGEKSTEHGKEAVAVDQSGKFARVTVFNNGGLNITTLGWWNLTFDNYDDQSEETKAFIGKLLGV